MGKPGQGRGRLVVISAPSGAGKTSIVKAILARNAGMRFSVSATTRPRREHEVEGVDYYFLTREEFLRRVAAGEFAEWQEIYGDCYGTLRSEIERGLQAKNDLLFDLDVKGALSIGELYPEALLIFIEPPSVESLRERLRDRRTENAAAFSRRVDRFPMELEMGKRFRHRVVNDVLGRAVEEVQEIIEHAFTH
jgi:guanylate kinase